MWMNDTDKNINNIRVYGNSQGQLNIKPARIQVIIQEVSLIDVSNVQVYMQELEDFIVRCRRSMSEESDKYSDLYITSEYNRIFLNGYRLETTEEVADRLQQSRIDDIEIEQDEIKELHRLKAKYE